MILPLQLLMLMMMMMVAGQRKSPQKWYPECAEGWRKLGGKLAEASLDFEARGPWKSNRKFSGTYFLRVAEGGGRWAEGLAEAGVCIRGWRRNVGKNNRIM